MDENVEGPQTMSGELAIILWLALVIASAVVVSYFAHRWGRDPFGWILLCAAMGPIALVGLFGTRQSDRARLARRPETGVQPPGDGPIIVACDGSKVSARLGEQAAAAYRTGRDVILLTVFPYEAERQDESAEVSDRAGEMTHAVRTLLGERGITPRIVVRYGPPGEAVVAFANEVGASLIIIGRRGSGLTRSLLGSVSRHVVEHAEAPVALVS
jgi:nucleotide-binding universal stress UspA family protein